MMQFHDTMRQRIAQNYHCNLQKTQNRNRYILTDKMAREYTIRYLSSILSIDINASLGT